MDNSTDSNKKITRKTQAPIKVYCLPEEKERIAANAAQAGKSSSAFLLAVGQGYEITGVVDAEQVRDMARINGDLGRMGGLLKLWLTDDKRTVGFKKSTLIYLLQRIEANQAELALTMSKVIRPRMHP
ncbi:conjugal transfer relaxosome component TraJ [Shewanella sairae]|uniref:Conjugal transfer relaxosome component TraJ n=1 Tax=Shewanella sairae TaxID=190310 RepID=A0ABQ4PS88_9GAMM|nr:conjugal transfer transcriptional regulator TraJ [Shewanella sairae]MCL1132698.1 conjugal transfer transcriptional regulator TraJ [Shewanella sairae]GIU52773.1 conjugal transfer relaxosome component TraJ [Shewanella sairae]